MKNINSKNLSIMMTDIKGYTDFSSMSSRQEIVELIDKHNELMKPVIDFYGGRIVKKLGDAFLTTFESATDAVVCAIIIQLIIMEYNNSISEENKKLNLRIVVNTGDVALKDKDIYGTAVNITARMEGMACFNKEGSIGISESTFLLLNRNEIISDYIGEFELKGIPWPVKVHSVDINKQKIANIPTKLLKLAQKASGHKFDFKESSKEWEKAINDFLNSNNIKDKINNFEHTISEKNNVLKEFLAGKTDNLKKNIENIDTDKVINTINSKVNKGFDFIKKKMDDIKK